MCGIAGAIDLAGNRLVPTDVLHGMADAIVHRGPDEDGYFQADGVSLANRRLSIVGLFDGKQPISNEDGSISVVFNGELFDYPEKRQKLEAKGHRFRTHCDTELFPHLWEEYGEEMFDHLHGQYAVALWDRRQRRLILARDRFGICPLYWSRQGDWLLFGSEIKAILASGIITARPDLRGINHVFTFFAMPGPVTCFQGISLLLPGHFLDIRTSRKGLRTVDDRIHWQIDFPDAGEEDRNDPTVFVDEFERLMLASIERRLRADVPVVSYLSGGVDSSLIVALASKIRGNPIPTFTIRIDDPHLDETDQAGIVSRHLGCEPTIVNFGADEVLKTYPRLIHAAESPVIDTSCAALLLLAQEVHRQGYKVALSGDGADEWLAGYPWYKVHKLLGWLDFIPGLPLSDRVRRLFLKWGGSPVFPPEVVQRARAAIGGPNPWLDIYGLVSLSKLRFFGPELRQVMAEHIPYSDIGFNLDRARKWHPLNRALYVGARIHLPGLQMHAKGDRIGMHNSVETRYPFLDEEIFAFLARIDPAMKMKGFGDKRILRLLAERYLPKEISWRRKAMFRAPFDRFHSERPPAFVEQLLSVESLRKTGYFDVEAVLHWRKAFKLMRARSTQRTSVEMGLAGVLSTQLWHHLFIDSSLAEMPSQQKPMLVNAG
ncbi:MAG: asparagine synthase (glutamine-hydrolyzing) [Planctomycetes bacterium]|nr:asparagine synthase (glutamine-hydrolyzing) [Planctomycetota bacterium]